MWASCALNGEKSRLRATASVAPDFSEDARNMVGERTTPAFNVSSVNARKMFEYMWIAEFVIRATSKPRFRLWVEFSEQGKSFFMQLSYVRFHVIHCWKHSPRTPKL